MQSPKPHRPAQAAELADVIRIVGGDDQDLAQDSAPRLRLRQLGAGIAREVIDDCDQGGEGSRDCGLPGGARSCGNLLDLQTCERRQCRARLKQCALTTIRRSKPPARPYKRSGPELFCNLRRRRYNQGGAGSFSV